MIVDLGRFWAMITSWWCSECWMMLKITTLDAAWYSKWDSIYCDSFIFLLYLIVLLILSQQIICGYENDSAFSIIDIFYYLKWIAILMSYLSMDFVLHIFVKPRLNRAWGLEMFCWFSSKAPILFEYELWVFLKMLIVYKHIDKYELIYLIGIVLELIFLKTQFCVV